MKKNFIGAAAAAVVLMVLFAACDNEPQEVKLVGYPLAAQVSSVTVTQTSNKYHIIVSWDAIKDGNGYKVYYQQEDKNTVDSFGAAQNDFTYPSASTVSGTYAYLDNLTANDDVDKWSAAISVKFTYTSYGLTYTRGTLPPGTYRFGVQSSDTDPNHKDSDIKWSDYITVAAPANL